MKTKIVVLTILCGLSLWAVAQAGGMGGSIGNGGSSAGTVSDGSDSNIRNGSAMPGHSTNNDMGNGSSPSGGMKSGEMGKHGSVTNNWSGSNTNN